MLQKNITFFGVMAVLLTSVIPAFAEEIAEPDKNYQLTSSAYVNAELEKKQDTLTNDNIKGTGSVSVSVADGVVTVSGTEIPDATATTPGLAKYGQIPSGGADAETSANIWVE